MSLSNLKQDLQKLADPEKAQFLKRFFKTGVGDYGEGDIFLGIKVPDSRKVALKYLDLNLADLAVLLKSQIHEERLVALAILTEQFRKAKTTELRKKIYDFYLKNAQFINNWDLVDLSADKIVGEYLLDKDWTVLERLAKSDNLWEKRIAIIATFAFLKKGQIEPTFIIAEILINDPHDLIQKAVGWMLREAGKKVSQEQEERFLFKHYQTMPRTMLRYAIERFPESLRKKYLLGQI